MQIVAFLHFLRFFCRKILFFRKLFIYLHVKIYIILKQIAMAKGSNGTRLQGSGGTNRESEKNFSGSAKLSQFEGSSFGNGANYSLTKGGYTLSIETDNITTEDGRRITTIDYYMQKGTGKPERIYTESVDRDTYRESMGVISSSNSTVARRVEGSMPYIAELANKWKKNNK